MNSWCSIYIFHYLLKPFPFVIVIELLLTFLYRFKRDSAVVVKERMEREFLINRGAQDQDGEEVEEQDENSSHIQVT